MIPALLLVDGRVTGQWRLPGSGTAVPARSPGSPGPAGPPKAELAEPVSALEAAYGVTVTGLTVTRG